MYYTDCGINVKRDVWWACALDADDARVSTLRFIQAITIDVIRAWLCSADTTSFCFYLHTTAAVIYNLGPGKLWNSTGRHLQSKQSEFYMHWEMWPSICTSRSREGADVVLLKISTVTWEWNEATKHDTHVVRYLGCRVWTRSGKEYMRYVRYQTYTTPSLTWLNIDYWRQFCDKKTKGATCRDCILEDSIEDSSNFYESVQNKWKGRIHLNEERYEKP